MMLDEYLPTGVPLLRTALEAGSDVWSYKHLTLTG
jgi:hypothetical protein